MDGVVTKPNSVHWKRPSWFRRRTGLERRLLALVVLLGFVAASLVAVLLNELMTDRSVPEVVLPPGKSTGCIEEQMCLTDECVEAAAGLLVNMNPDVDPCEDFYEYSCGDWLKSRVIPEATYRIHVTSELEDRLVLNCRGLVENDISDEDPEAIYKAKNLYKACMDEEKLNSRGFEPLRSIISRFGGWPLLNDTTYDETSWNLEDTLSKVYTATAQNYLLQSYISVDPRNSAMYIFAIDQPYTPLGKEDYMVANYSHKNVVVYREYMEAVAMELSLASEDEVRRQVFDMIRLEARIVNITLPKVDRMKVVQRYQRLTVTELQELVPQLDWFRYFGGIVSPNMREDELIATFCRDYLEALGKVLQSTPKRTIANLLMWRLVHDSIPLLDRKARKLAEEFRYQVLGEQAEAPRWKICVDMTSEHMSSAMSAMFVQQYFDQQSKTMTLEMIGNIRGIVLEMLNSTKWMDDVTKSKAIEKLDALREFVGYADWLKNSTVLTQEYKDMHITSDKHFENVFQTLRNNVKFSLKKFRQAVDKYRWPDLYKPYQANALYQFALNQIVFPAGVLQHPFYNRRNSQSMNYGGIGVVIAHEFLHAFDDRGRSFDKNGNIGEMWTDESVEGFIKQTSCLVEQYSNFTVKQVNRKVNGRQTLGENIGDNSGLRIAYKAYRRWVEHNGAEERPLPGINLTHDQIFFLNFGQLWCSKRRDQAMLYYMQTNSHAPAKFRAVGSLMNSHEFAEAFQCRSGSVMNPTEKCVVYDDGH